MDLMMEEEIRKGNIERVRYLLNEHGLAHDTNWRDYYILKSALCYKQKDIAKLLLERGARVNKVSNKIRTIRDLTTPLHLAISLGCPEIIETILNRGASLDEVNHNSESPLATAAIIGNYAVVDRILSAITTETNRTCIDGLTHLHIASMRNRADIVERFLCNGAKVNGIINLQSGNWPGYTALHFAVEFQCLETVKLLINFGADVTVKNARGLTPLHLAFRVQNESIIDTILTVHSYICDNPMDSGGLSHFHIACARNDSKIVEDFMQWGVDVDLKVNSDAFKWSSYTPLSFAVEHQSIDVIKLLLLYNPVISKHVLNLVYQTSNPLINDLIYTKLKPRNRQTIERRSSLSSLHIACINNDLSAVKGLLNISVNVNGRLDVNSPTWLGCTPLHLAVQGKHKDMVILLVDSGADITAKDNRGKTALHLAFEIGQEDIVNCILSAHTNMKDNPMDNTGLSHFHIACTRNDLSLIKDLLENGVDINRPVSIESAFWPGNTALHFACVPFQPKVVELLLSHGADVTACNKSGLLPLESVFKIMKMNSRKKGSKSFLTICDLLLSAQDTRGFRVHNGLTRFYLACATDDTDAVQRLFDIRFINQPVDLPNWSGRTPLHFAVFFNSSRVTKLLFKLGADPTIEDAKGYTALELGLHANLYDLPFSFEPCKDFFYYKGNVNSDAGLFHFHQACDMYHMKAIEYFLKRGVDVNSLFETPFQEVHTPLQVILSNYKEQRRTQAINLLLRNGADVNKVDLCMNTPLHFAGEIGACSEIMKLLLENGADCNVNSQNFEGNTPMHLCCRDVAIQHTAIPLLECGADVNIENNKGETFLMIFEDDNIPIDPGDEIDGLELTVCFLKHVKKLQTIDFHVSDKNKLCYASVMDFVREDNDFDEVDFADECKSELNSMKMVKLDNYTTLRDIIFKDSDKMARHVKNAKFRQILESNNFGDRFPIYGFLLKLQLKKGLARKSLLKTSRASMKSLTIIQLPDSCYEHILQYLSNEELDALSEVPPGEDK